MTYLVNNSKHLKNIQEIVKKTKLAKNKKYELGIVQELEYSIDDGNSILNNAKIVLSSNDEAFEQLDIAFNLMEKSVNITEKTLAEVTNSIKPLDNSLGEYADKLNELGYTDDTELGKEGYELLEELKRLQTFLDDNLYSIKSYLS